MVHNYEPLLKHHCSADTAGRVLYRHDGVGNCKSIPPIRHTCSRRQSFGDDVRAETRSNALRNRIP